MDYTVRSVRVFRFYSTSSIRDIVKRLEEYSNDTLYTTSNITHDQETVTAIIQDRTSRDLEYNIFYLNISKQFGIIQRSNTLLKGLRYILDPVAAFEEIEENKDIMKAIAESLLEKNCIIYDPRFSFDGAKYDDLVREGFTVSNNRCATSRKGYDERIKIASMFEPIFRIPNIDSIGSELDDASKLLRMKNTFAFSMYSDNDFSVWINFINEHIWPHLKIKGSDK